MINCTVAIVVSLKSRTYVFDKSYYKSVVLLLYNDQSRHKYKLSFMYIFMFMENKTIFFVKILKS